MMKMEGKLHCVRVDGDATGVGACIMSVSNILSDIANWVASLAADS